MEKAPLGPQGSKGKGKAKAEADPQTSSVPNNSRSLASRVLASASGLARDVTGPANGEVSSSLMSSSNQAGKSYPIAGSSSSRAPLAESLESRYASSTNSGNTPYTQDSSFRSPAEATSTAEEFNNFAVEGNGAAMYNVVDVIANGNGMTWTSEFREDLAAHNALDYGNQDQFSLLDRGYAGDTYDDGAEVRKLLSDPEFVALTDVYDTEDPTPEAAADLFSQDFSQAEQHAANSIRSALPQPPVHHIVSAENSLNLQPHFDLDTLQLGQGASEAAAGFGRGGESSVLFSSPAQREQWFSEWNEVLSGYTDEVWGELLPEVRAAKQQLEEVKTGSGSLDTKAIARLKMILGHVGGQSVTTRGLNQAISSAQSRAARAQPEEESDSSIAEFHCPWISCHERFHNMRDLRRHSTTHRQYSCPHISCSETFTAKSEWAKHISIAHHGLLDTGMEVDDEE